MRDREYEILVELGPDPDVARFMENVIAEGDTIIPAGEGRTLRGGQILDHLRLRTCPGFNAYKFMRKLYETVKGNRR
ncbi:MAG: hypothetical protein ABH864_05780 [archaeon]